MVIIACKYCGADYYACLVCDKDFVCPDCEDALRNNSELDDVPQIGGDNSVMMEYYAFKALSYLPRANVFVSPIMGSKWGWVALNGGIYPAITVKDEHDVDVGYGIFASTEAEALNYGDKLYLVAPLPDQNGKVKFYLGTRGWRSASAVVVAGPFSPGDERPHEIIVDAWRNGYRQVDMILAIALAKLGDDRGRVMMEQMVKSGKARAEALDMLVSIYGSLAIPTLRKCLHDRSERIRYIACRALGMLGDVESIHLLADIARNDKKAMVREIAITALGSIAARYRIGEVKNILVDLLDDQNEVVRRVAGRELGFLNAVF